MPTVLYSESAILLPAKTCDGDSTAGITDPDLLTDCVTSEQEDFLRDPPKKSSVAANSYLGNCYHPRDLQGWTSMWLFRRGLIQPE
jgi:hypothetical protein